MASHARRVSASEGKVGLRFGEFEYDPQRHELKKFGVRVRIQRQPLAILLTLLESPGSLVTREELRSRLWDSATFVAFEHGLNSAIKRLRDVLCDSVDHPRYIETVPGEGYRFIASVERLGPVLAPSVAAVQPASPTAPSAARDQHPARRKTWLWVTGVAAAVILAVMAVSFRNWAPLHKPTLKSQAPDWVLIANFENRTGDTVLDGTLVLPLERELRNSKTVNLVPRERVDDTLRLMRKPVDTKIDPALGREICLRDGEIQLLILGRVEKLDANYLLTSFLVNPSTGATVLSLSETAEQRNQVLSALEKLAARNARAVENQPPQIAGQLKKLEKVTTSSLHALQLYSSASELLLEAHGVNLSAINLLEQAIELDPQFVSAQALLVHALGAGDTSSAVAHGFLQTKHKGGPDLAKMFELAGTVPDRERYFILGNYYEALRQIGKAVEQYEVLVRLYPDHIWGINCLAELYHNKLRWPDAAVPYFVRRADLRPSDFLDNAEAAQLLSETRKPESAELYRARAEKLMTPQVIEQFPRQSIGLLCFDANQLVVDAKPLAALNEMQRCGQLWESLNPDGRAALASGEVWGYAAIGRIKDAKGWLARTGIGPDYDWPAANIADAEGDYGRFLYYLSDIDDDDKTTAPVVALLARLHQDKEARRLFRKLQDQPGFTGAELYWVRGEFARAHGNVSEAEIELKAAVSAFRISDDVRLHSQLPAVSEVLADLLQEQGDTEGAIAVLEPVKLEYSGQFPEYARILVKLSKLYNQVQRFADQQKIDSELQTRFALADADYFVSQYLQGESPRAARGPEVAAVNSIAPY
jgi:DNA-binding winged helix-turn-helix (wHTH) protein/tetratricopeptide (TPR) repeat protein